MWMKFPEMKHTYRYRSTGYPIGQNWGFLIDWEQDGGYWNSESLANPNRVTYGFGTPGPGDFVYKDLNNDGVVNDKDLAPIGVGSIPRYNYGFSMSANWKGFDAYIFFQGLAKFNSTFAQQGTYEYTVRGTYFPYHKKAWTEERWINGEEITYPALHTQESVNHRANSFFIFDRDLFRLKNFEIGYTLPANSLKILGVSSARFFISGQNVFTWSPKFRPTHLIRKMMTLLVILRTLFLVLGQVLNLTIIFYRIIMIKNILTRKVGLIIALVVFICRML